MSCEEVMEFMQRHLDHDLNEEEAKRMREHAEGCAECSDMLRRLEMLNEDLENLPKVTPAFSIVDSILPKLQELDAAANAAGDGQAAARQEQDAVPAVVPPRRSRRTFRTPAWTAGGIAAAAVLLGVMIFNGLPEAYKEQSSRSMEGSAASSAESSLFAADTAADAPAADNSATMKSVPAEEAANTEEAPAAEAPELERPALESQAAAPNPDAPVSSRDQAGPEADRSAKNNRAEVAAVPGSSGGTDKEEGGGSPSAAGDQEAAQEVRPETEPIQGEGDMFGIAAMPEEPADAPESEPVPPAELQDGTADRNKGFAAAPAPSPAPSPAMELATEDGSLTAKVRTKEEGNFVVVVSTEDGALLFASENVWPADTEIRFNEWAGSIVRYTVAAPDGEHTFAIDVSAGTEEQLAR